MKIKDFEGKNKVSIDLIIRALNEEYPDKDFNEASELTDKEIELLMNLGLLEQDTSVVTTLEKSMIGEEITALSKDMGEVVLDTFLDNDILKSIPVFNVLHSAVKIGSKIKDGIFAKKVYRFLFELKDVSQEERERFIEKVEADPKYQTKVGEKVVQLLDKADDYAKASMMGRLMRAAIKNELEYDVFLRLAFVLNQIFAPDVYLLRDLEQKRGLKQVDVESLIGTGLINTKATTKKVAEPGTMVRRYKDVPILKYEVNDLGKLLTKYALEKE